MSSIPTGALAAQSEPAAPHAAPADGHAPEDRRAVRLPLDAPLLINGRFAGTINVEIDAQGDGTIEGQRLVDLLSPVIAADLKSRLVALIAARQHVDLRELKFGELDIGFDTLSLSVVATLKLGSAAASNIAVVERQPVPDPRAFDQPERFAAGVNIAATQRYVHGAGGGFQPVKAELNAIANFGGFEGVTLTGGAGWDGRRWERREIRATRDFFKSALRLTVGEFTPGATSFQGSGRILGIGLERAFATIRPFQNVRPIGRQEFQLDRDANIDVFVNDLRVQTIRLAAGRYNLSDFPLAGGSNNVRLVVDDIGGRREIVNFSIFSNAQLLTPGVTEFGVAAGLRETTPLTYVLSPVVTAYGYRGLTDNLTLGFNGQATSRGAQVGASVIVGTPIGFFQFDGALSKSFGSAVGGPAGGGGRIGGAATIDYRGTFSLLSHDDLRLNVSSTYRSAGFTDSFSLATLNQQALQNAVFLQWQAPFSLSTGVGFTQTLFRNPRLTVTRADGFIGRTFGRFGVNCSVSRTTYSDGRSSDVRGTIGLSLRLGSRYFASARYDTGTQRKEVEISRVGDGRLDDFSGEVRLSDDRTARAISGRVAYVNNRFDAVINHNRLTTNGINGGVSNSSEWNFRTFIGYAGGSFAIGRSVNDGFVIAPLHHSLAGSQIRVTSGDRVIARSGLCGPALVPIDRAYGISRREIAVDPLPVGYDLGSGAINIFPGYGTGYRIPVGSDASRIAVGYLANATGPLALVAGTIVAIAREGAKQSEPHSVFTNRAGRFVADHLAPGRYRITMSAGQVEFTVPAQKEGLIDVGTLLVTP